MFWLKWASRMLGLRSRRLQHLCITLPPLTTEDPRPYAFPLSSISPALHNGEKIFLLSFFCLVDLRVILDGGNRATVLDPGRSLAIVLGARSSRRIKAPVRGAIPPLPTRNHWAFLYHISAASLTVCEDPPRCPGGQVRLG